MRREKRAGKIEVERGSGNVYEDLGFTVDHVDRAYVGEVDADPDA